MNTLTHWNPFREMQDLQNRVLHALQAKAAAAGNGQQESITVAEWAPAVDITEDAAEYLIKAELPEIKREDVKVTVENGMLTLSGERRLEKEESGRKYPPRRAGLWQLPPQLPPAGGHGPRESGCRVQGRACC